MNKELNELQKILVGYLKPTYKKVHINIKSGYELEKGWTIPQEQFKAEIFNIFKDLGWEITVPAESSGIAMSVKKYGQYLYLHPMLFSGYLTEKEILILQKKLNKAKSISIETIEILDDVYDLSNYTLRKIFKENIEKIDEILIKRFTSFKNKETSPIKYGYGISIFLEEITREMKIFRNNKNSYLDCCDTSSMEYFLLEDELNFLLRSGKIKK